MYVYAYTCAVMTATHMPENIFLNFVNPFQICSVITLFRLIWPQTEFSLVLNRSPFRVKSIGKVLLQCKFRWMTYPCDAKNIIACCRTELIYNEYIKYNEIH